MREIKFRGKSAVEVFDGGDTPDINLGDWIYGNLIIDKNEAFIVNGVVECTDEYISIELVALSTDITEAVQSAIRTEKLKLLDRLSSHQEDLFWWTGGEYEKTKAVDMRAISAERDKLTKLEAEI